MRGRGLLTLSVRLVFVAAVLPWTAQTTVGGSAAFCGQFPWSSTSDPCYPAVQLAGHNDKRRGGRFVQRVRHEIRIPPKTLGKIAGPRVASGPRRTAQFPYKASETVRTVPRPGAQTTAPTRSRSRAARFPAKRTADEAGSMRQTRQRGSESMNPRVLTREIVEAGTPSKLLALLDQHVEHTSFNHFHMSAAFTRLVKMSKSRTLSEAEAGSTVWQRLAARLRNMLHEGLLPPRESANVFWAMAGLHAQVGQHVAVALPALAEHISKVVDKMIPQHLSNCLWAAATLQEAAPEVLSAVPALAERIPRIQNDTMMGPQALSNCLWAAATLHQAVPQVLVSVPAIAERIPQEVHSMIPQHLANCLWAAATLQEEAPQVLRAVPAVANCVPQAVDRMIPQELSNCLWAAATLHEAVPPTEYGHQDLWLWRVLLCGAQENLRTTLPALVKRIPQVVDRMTPQALSNCFWAAAKLRGAAPEVLTVVPVLADRIPQVVGSMIPKHLVNCLWAATTLEQALGVVPFIAEHMRKRLMT